MFGEVTFSQSNVSHHRRTAELILAADDAGVLALIALATSRSGEARSGMAPVGSAKRGLTLSRTGMDCAPAAVITASDDCGALPRGPENGESWYP